MIETVKVSAWVLLGIAISLITADNAQAQTRIAKETSKKTTETWVADKVKTGLETTVVDSMMVELLEMEEDAYPADDIYESWNTEYVKAYRDAVVPDSFIIDVSTFIMPVEGRVTSNYGPRKRRFHYGTDFKLQIGDTVRAAFDGKVRVKNYERRGYGNYVVLRHPNGLETVYGHLSEFLVGQDENVTAGQPIALGGNTGRSTGPHLHFEFRFLGNPINPGEIIDLDEMAIKDDAYMYVQAKSGESYYSTSKYMAGGANKIKYHRVKKGDTLKVLARRYGTSVDKLCRLNKLKTSSALRVGKTIRIS